MLENRTILVTGANRGIGLAIVETLANNTHDRILLGARSFESAEKAAKKLPANVMPVVLNLSSKEATAAHIDKIRAEYGSIDVLINNAGVLNEGSFLGIDEIGFEESTRVNVAAVFQLIRAFAPHMQAQNYGRIVNVSSGWGSFEDGLTGPFAYSFSKAALNALTLTLAQELNGNVKVNAMCPGWVRTRMGGMMASRSPKEGADTAVWLANIDEKGSNGGFFRDRKLIDW